MSDEKPTGKFDWVANVEANGKSNPSLDEAIDKAARAWAERMKAAKAWVEETMASNPDDVIIAESSEGMPAAEISVPFYIDYVPPQIVIHPDLAKKLFGETPPRGWVLSRRLEMDH